MDGPKFKVPILVQRTGPPIGDADIAEWENEHSLKFPDDYREFLLRWNGGLLTPSSIDVSDGARLSYSRPAKLSEHYERLEDAPPQFVDIGDDFGGNHFLLCLHPSKYGQIFWADHEVAPSENPLRGLLHHTPTIWQWFFPNMRFVAPSFSDLCERLYCDEHDYIEHIAATDDIDALRQFIDEYGVDYKSYIGTPLIEAMAWNGTVEMVQLLLEGNPALGESLLRAIVNDKGSAQIVEILLQHGADPNIQNSNFSALKLARERNNSAVEKLLLSHGASG